MGATTMEPPRIIHRIWVGPPMPEHLSVFGDRWADLHPDWQVRLWGDDDLGWLTNRPLFDRAEQLVPADAVGQFRSDIARYEILAAHGGVYVDCDFEPLRPIDELHTHPAWAGWELQDTWIANGMMGGAFGDPFFQALIDGLPASVAAHHGKRPTHLSGPRYLTRMWRRLGGCHIWPQRFLYPYGYDQLDRAGGDYGDAYTVHHWHHQRTIRNLPL